MKGKFRSMWRVVIAMVLVAGLSLVVAAPVPAATPADTDVGFLFGTADKDNDTVEWADISEEGIATLTSTLPAGGLGSYSVKLAEVNGSGEIYSYVQLIPTSGTTLSDLDALTNDWSFWYYFVSSDNQAGPLLELRFKEPGSARFVDITVMGADANPLYTPHLEVDTWTEVVLADDMKTVGYWSEDPSIFNDGADQTLSAAVTAVLANAAIDGDWELDRVQIQLYENSPVRTFYIDDITIDGTLYELEPIFLDAEYYSVGDTVQVTVPNFAANTDSVRINPVAAEVDAGVLQENWTVTATSDSDPGDAITVALEETGANTGVFTGSFTTTTTLPVAEDEVYVEDGDTITVTYLTSAPFWGVDGATTTTIEALVDDTVPTITPVSPKDDEDSTIVDGATTEDATPVIKATYSDAISPIDKTSVEMLVNGVDVTDDDATTVTDSSVTYTPTDPLDDGSYDVTVNVSDLAGNAATPKTWSFRIVSWLEGPESATDKDLDALDTVGVAVSITGDDTTTITVGRYASNPEPDAPPTFSLIENGFFDVKVTDAGDATQIVIKFADDNITADSVAYFWGDVEGEWLECSDQDYSVANEWLWVKVRTTTTPSIAELTGTPFAISGVPPDDILAYYRAYSGDAEVVETTDLLKAANDWADEVVPSGFTDAISTTQLLTLANEWAATE